MDIRTESIFFNIIEKVVSQAGRTLSPSFQLKFKNTWKKNIQKSFQSSKKLQRKKKISSPDSDSEYLLPECNDAITGTLDLFRKEKPFWKIRLSNCIRRSESSNDQFYSKATALVKSDFFKD